MQELTGELGEWREQAQMALALVPPAGGAAAAAAAAAEEQRRQLEEQRGVIERQAAHIGALEGQLQTVAARLSGVNVSARCAFRGVVHMFLCGGGGGGERG